MSTAAFCAVLLSFHPPALWANFRPRGQGLALAVPPAPRWAMLSTISMVATLTVQTRRSRSITLSLWSEKR